MERKIVNHSQINFFRKKSKVGNVAGGQDSGVQRVEVRDVKIRMCLAFSTDSLEAVLTLFPLAGEP